MQQVTKQEAYERLISILAPLEEELYEQTKGRGLAQYREHEDGGAVVTVLGGQGQYVRNPDGTVYYSNINGDHANYGLFLNAYRRSAINYVTLFDLHINDRIFKLLGEQEWFDGSEEHNRAAARHSHRITGRLIRPTRPTDRVKHLAKTIYNLYDPHLFSLLMRVTSGRDRDAAAYNALATLKNPEDINPAVLATYINLMRRTLHEVDDTPHRDPVQVTQTVRQALMDEGELRRATWRYLLRLPARHAARLAATNTADDLRNILDALARAGETPRWSILPSVINAYHHLRQNGGNNYEPERFVQYARMLSRHTSKMRGIRQFAHTQNHSLILDWLVSGVNLTPTQAALPYDWWTQQAQGWHDDPNGPVQQRLREQRARNRYYQAEQAAIRPIHARHHQERQALMQTLAATYFIDSHQHRGVTITALTTASQLEAEGDTMQHCVGTYADAVHMGVSRIYHLEGHGHKSTLELRHSFEQWRISQHQGVRNKLTSEEHQRAGRALLRAYNKDHPHAHEDQLAELNERHTRELAEAKAQARQELITSGANVPPERAPAAPVQTDDHFAF